VETTFGRIPGSLPGDNLPEELSISPNLPPNMPAASDALPILARLMEDPFVVADVGARWGFATVWDPLGDRCLLLGFEPDEAECERLTELNRTRRWMRFIPVALGARRGLATLYLTKSSASSSLYPPSGPAIARHPGLDVQTQVGTATIEVTTMDEWCAEEGIERVDFIKVDTQGSELDILSGASATLDGVRAVEAEVEFNELYEGAPLFPAVDRFLRDRGFVLWKLRDLAHYGQAGAETQWRSQEVFYYDSTPSSFSGGAGGLFWANAFFLKESVAYPEASLGWRQLVRDAILTGALGFLDLSARALELARETAPEEVRGDLDAARSAAVLAGRRERELLERPAVLDGSVKVGFAEPGFTGGGWGPPQELEFGGVRWSGPGRDAWVDVPFTVPPGTRVELLLVAALSPDIAEGLALEVNRVPVPLQRSPHERGLLYAGRIPDGYESPRHTTQLVVRTPFTLPWNTLSPGNDDTEVGVALAWLRLTSP